MIYCYTNQNAANHLRPIVEGAIEKWTSAFEHLVLAINVASGCNGDLECISTLSLSGEPVDALVISQDDSVDCTSRGTTGYNCADTNESGRHILRSCGYFDDAEQATVYQWVLSVAHELGKSY